MKYLALIFLLCVLFAASACNNNYPKAENAFDAGREFIDASLKGDWERAQAYLLHNDANDKYFQQLENNYEKKNSDEKRQYNTASINILEEDTISDSVHIINYKNSYDKIARKVKVVLTKDGWLVDLAYTFNPNL